MSSSTQRWLLHALSPGGSRAQLMIFAFHRVLDRSDPLLQDEPSAEVFARQMDWLAEVCNVLPLPEASARLTAGTLPARAASITFDDGYLDNYTTAAPILRERNLPATFFIAADAVDSGVMWNDLVIEGIRLAPQSLDLRSEELDEFELVDAVDRQRAIDTVLSAIKYQPLEERQTRAESVYRHCGATGAPTLMMSRAQVAELHAQGFDIGAHTMNHPILAELDLDTARWEISASRDWLRDITGSDPVSFAYPNGRPVQDYRRAHAELVLDLGFELAVTTAWGCADRRYPVPELPRFTPWERDRSGFVKRLVKTSIKSRLSAPDIASC